MRPEHPDFELIARLARKFDDMSDQDKSLEVTMEKISEVDMESLMYLVTNRAAIMMQRTGLPKTASDVHSMIASAMINGFVIGENFQLENPSLDGIVRRMKAEQKEHFRKMLKEDTGRVNDDN